MKEEEIIKALPTIYYGGHSCRNCKYEIDGSDERCGIKGCNIARNALDLIKCKNTEIDILIRKKEALRDEITELQAEIERLKG